jgi:hypothetical protein
MRLTMRLARSTTTSHGQIADEERSWSLIPNAAVNGIVYVGRPQEAIPFSELTILQATSSISHRQWATTVPNQP